jgi:hypothetical protein
MDGRECFLVHYWSMRVAAYSFYYAISGLSVLASGSGAAELG